VATGNDREREREYACAAVYLFLSQRDATHLLLPDNLPSALHFALRCSREGLAPENSTLFGVLRGCDLK